MVFDEDTLLDRIGHQLNRLYQMMQAGKSAVEEQRSDLQSLISDISHQVKTPAANLKMAAAALLEQELPRRQQVEYLQSMSVQIDKLDFLMSSMVKASRLEAGAIFQRFYREPEVHNREGIGIGLYLAREIIAKQGGRVKVTSSEGEGTDFTIFPPND